MKRTLIFCLIFVVAIVIRLALGAQSDWRQAESLVEKGEQDFAAMHFARVVRWHFPASPWTAKAVTRLKQLAQQASEHGDKEIALHHWRRLQAGIASVRSFYQPYKSDLQLARLHIAKNIIALHPEKDQSIESILAEYERVQPPKPWLVMFTLIGFFGWISSTIRFIFVGFDEQGRLVPSEPARWSGIGAVAFFAIWLWALTLV